MSDLYGGTLRIDDGFTITLNRFKNSMNGAGSSLKKFTNESSRSSIIFRDKWSRAFSDIGRSSEKMTSRMVKNLTKITATWLSVQTAIKGTKKIIDAGIDIQNSKMYIDAVFGKSGNVVQKFKQAQDFAAKTPFNSVEITNAMAKAQMLNLGTSEEDMKRYADLGSIAKLNGSGSIGEAVDAYADMMNGEFERMQTILGIKKRDLEQYAKENNMGKFTNKKGQVKNKELLAKVFDSYIDSRGITGITEKYSQTLEGRFSTLSDNFNRTLGRIGGIQEDGTVKAGSLFDNIGKMVERFIESLDRFGKSEAFDVLQDNLGKIGDAIINFIDTLTENPEKVQEIFDDISAFFSAIFTVGKWLVDNIEPIMDTLGSIFVTSKLGKIGKFVSSFISPKDFIGPKPVDPIKGFIEEKSSDYSKSSDSSKSSADKTMGKASDKKNGIVFNKSVFDKSIFNNAKFIDSKGRDRDRDRSRSDRDSKRKSNKSKSKKGKSSVKNELIPYEKPEIVPYQRGGALTPYQRGGSLVPYQRGGSLIPYQRGGALTPYQGHGSLKSFAKDMIKDYAIDTVEDYLIGKVEDGIGSLIKKGGAKLIGSAVEDGVSAGIGSGATKFIEGVEYSVSSGIGKSGVINTVKSLATKAGPAAAEAAPMAAAVVAAITSVLSFVNPDGIIHGGINSAGSLITGEEKDYSSRLYGYGVVKPLAWLGNKFGIYDDDDYEYAKKSIANYIQNSDDYINGKTNQKPDIGHMGNYHPTNNNTVNVNIDKIEKDVDTDELVDKLSEIMDSWNDRNAIGRN